MHTFTALFDKRADAEAIQARLEQLGVVDLDHGVHDRETAGLTDTASPDGSKAMWASGGGAIPPHEDRHLYEEAVRRGGALLTVNVDDQQADQVARILEGSNAVDFDERERELKQSGFLAPVPAAPARADGESEQRIQLVEEQLRVGKRQVERGGVRVRAYVVETPVKEQVQLREEHVEIERRPVNERVRDTGALFKERTLEFTETAEEAVVGKEARVVEEVVVNKQAGQRTETISDTVRRTEVEVQDTRTREGRSFAVAELREHAEVLGSDGQRVGKIDHIEGQARIKLAKADAADGQHHFIPVDWVETVQGDTVRLRIPAAQARQGWSATG